MAVLEIRDEKRRAQGVASMRPSILFRREDELKECFLRSSMRGPHIARLLLPLAVASVAGGMLFSNTSDSEAGPQTGILPPAKAAAHVHIISGPALESVRDNIAIIQWTSNHPGGSDEHFGIVHYGTDPKTFE
jgi:hypothetical protein